MFTELSECQLALHTLKAISQVSLRMGNRSHTGISLQQQQQQQRYCRYLCVCMCVWLCGLSRCSNYQHSVPPQTPKKGTASEPP